MKFSFKDFFNKPFFKGMMNIFGTGNYYYYNNYKINTLNSSDEAVLKKDWEKIGEDFEKIIKRYSNGH